MIAIAEETKKDEKKESKSDKIECPTCGAKVEPDATECPECGEKLGDEEKEEAEEEDEDEEEEDEDEEEELEDEPEAPGSSSFYAGVIIFLIGLAISFGVWIHYQAKIDLPGINEDFNKFGPTEMAIAIVGVIIFLIGLGIVAVSMRTPGEPEEAEEKGEPEEDEEEDAEEEEEDEVEDEAEEEEPKKE